MPDIKTFNELAAGHGEGIAALAIACFVMMAAIVALWRENRALMMRIEALLVARVAGLEHVLAEGARSETSRSSRK